MPLGLGALQLVHQLADLGLLSVFEVMDLGLASGLLRVESPAECEERGVMRLLHLN